MGVQLGMTQITTNLEQTIEIALGLTAAEQWNSGDYSGAAATIANTLNQWVTELDRMIAVLAWNEGYAAGTNGFPAWNPY